MGGCRLSLLVLSAAAFVGCARATGEVQGGEATFEATPQQLGSGTHWSDLYRDLFGPTSFAGCGTAACHGSPTGEGAMSKAGIHCFDSAGCWQSMHDKGLVSMPADMQHPENSNLIGVLRHDDDKGNEVGFMPKSPPVVFSKDSIDRIETWLKNGAPND